jgi:hypothetical protein
MKWITYLALALTAYQALAGEPPQSPRPQGPVKIISDELVANLSCNNVNSEAIYKAIRPDAFGLNRRILIRNYSTRIFNGQCWAIARAQRLNLLLGRQDGTAPYNQENIESLISGTQVPPSKAGLEPVEVAKASKPANDPYFMRYLPGLSPLAVLVGYSRRMGEEFAAQTVEAIRTLLPRSEFDTFSWPKDGRRSIGKFTTAIDVAQARLFLRLKNLPFLFKEQTEQNFIANLNQIATLARAKKLPLINMRYKRSEQHVVVVTDFIVTEKDHYWLQVIDSELPEDQSRALEIKRVNGQLKAFWNNENPDVFLVEEGERLKLNRALVRHYNRLCSKR